MLEMINSKGRVIHGPAIEDDTVVKKLALPNKEVTGLTLKKINLTARRGGFKSPPWIKLAILALF